LSGPGGPIGDQGRDGPEGQQGPPGPRGSEGATGPPGGAHLQGETWGLMFLMGMGTNGAFFLLVWWFPRRARLLTDLQGEGRILRDTVRDWR
jgi:hypothetical protein